VFHTGELGENGIVRLQTLPAIYCQQMHFDAFGGKGLAKTIVCGRPFNIDDETKTSQNDGSP